ncbi:phosphoglycerate mutase-like protein [Gigaspora margarita]|uniref:Multiple inositol polyphosphate phosphatase 1 n=1 Tax=Gigaspora margarita TaxID=4874 RepID=A0A8H3WX60_GIGMA|nr:phosphoglycerate mutase-like protein [Gigaspora margarita]
MQSYNNLYSFFILLFYFYNLALCENDYGSSKLFHHDPQDLIRKHYFEIEPAETAFTLDIKPISYPDKCELKQLHLLTRHGSRYPAPPDIRAFDHLEKVFANVSVAKKWAGAYSRCGASAMAFSEGLFNGDGPLDTCKNQPVYVWNIPANEDNIIEMYNNCLLANETVLNNNPTYDQQNYTYANTTLKPIADRMTKDYGIYPPLNPYLIPSIYDACEFWILHFNRTDTWCLLLSELDIIKSVYYWEMTIYYKSLYGNPLNEQLGCVYYTRLVNSVDNYLNGSSIMVADLKNGHGHTMFLELTALVWCS